VPPTPEPDYASRAPTDVDGYVSSSDRYEGLSFRAYAQVIDDYPRRFFDVVVVDGRARPSCFKHAVEALAPGGLLVFDNTERDHYRPASRLARPTMRRMDYPGPVPFLPHLTITSMWYDQAGP
jgi:predicted O-methyltransferase YrrM